MKKTKKVSVDKDFLMKIANQVDTLTKRVDAMTEEIIDENKDGQLNYSTTFRVSRSINFISYRDQFLLELKNLLDEYHIVKMTMEYKK